MVFEYAYANAGIHKDIRSNQTVADVRRLVCDRLLGESDGSVDKERLGVGQSNEACSRKYDFQKWPFECNKYRPEQRIRVLLCH